MKMNLLVILGPTASGKTALAVRLASDLCGDIISADSRQVYRGMDIGTGKDLSEYQTEKGKIPVHLIDIIEPKQEFNVFEFQKRFYEIFTALHNKKVLPVLVGGTGLYLESVLTDYDLPAALPDERLRDEMAGKTQAQLQEILLALKPALHNRTDLDDRDRLIRKIEIERARQSPSGSIPEKPFVNAGIFGIHWERDVLRQRIARRLAKRIDEGMIEEVSRLHLQGLPWERLDSFGLEYRYVAMYLQNKLTLTEMSAKLQIAIGQFAKRQMTWFRRMEKKGVKIEWVSGDNYADLHRRVLKVLS